MTNVPAGMGAAVASMLLAAALLVVPDRARLPVPAVGRRARGHRRAGGGADSSRGVLMPGEAGSGSDGGRAAARRRSWLVAVALAGGIVLMAPDVWWLAVGASVIVGVVLARHTGRRSPARLRADRRQLAVHEDLLASCLDAGMAVAPALRAVAQALSGAGSAGPADFSAGITDLANGGPIAALDAVAAMLALGADPDTAWQHADLDPDLAPLAAAARRSASGGAGFADAVREHAAALRARAAAESVQAAGRAGVLMTAPLGLCFLPAFVCWGLAPVVVGLIGKLNIF